MRQEIAEWPNLNSLRHLCVLCVSAVSVFGRN
jgi:hypothetical protein